MKRELSILAGLLTATVSATASAQFGGTIGWNPQSGGTGTGYGMPVPAPSSGSSSGQSSDLEIGSLYVAGTAYGIGTGVWLDAELGITDPGLRFIAPAVLGVGAPIGVYFLDHPPMPRGVPAAISLGLTLGAGEGFGVWSYQFVTSSKEEAWGFRGLARGSFIGATIGGAAGAAVGFTQEPSPKTSLFVGSSARGGAGIGTMFGYGSTSKDQGYGLSNDGASLGGLIGYNAGIVGSAALSTVWIPTYKNTAFMWGGAAVGFLATTPVYLFYAGSDSPAKRGLIVQGVGTTLGIVAGAMFTFYDKDDIATTDPYRRARPPIAQLTGIGPMPIPGGGAGAMVQGVLFLAAMTDLWPRVIESIPTAMCAFRVDGTFVAASHGFAALVGKSVPDVLATSYWQLAPDGDRQRELNAIISGDGRPYEKELIGREGERIAVVAVGGVVTDKGDADLLSVSFQRRLAAGAASTEAALRRQNELLFSLAKREEIDDGHFESALQIITEAATAGMSCDRASVWLYDDACSKITCVDLHESSKQAHASGVELNKTDFPGYFEALAESRQIVADDAHRHPATREFSQPYLTPLGIGALLDAPIRFHGKTVGVVCHEHVGPARGWTQDEQNFAASLADLVARSMEARDRRRAEDALELANAELEARVEERTRELQAARDALWGEMQLARRIQTVLVPPRPTLPGFELAAFTRPATEVGGDFYDVIEAGHLNWVVIGDVSGHGLPAGLVMMMCQTAIRAVLAANPHVSPSELLTATNKVLRHNVAALGEDRYVTISVLRFSPDGRITHAGMHTDILVHRAGARDVEVFATEGVFLGLTDDIAPHLPQSEFSMKRDDVMLLFTDGISEARSANGAMLEVASIADSLRTSASGGAGAVVMGLERLLRDVDVHDDVTAVAVRCVA